MSYTVHIDGKESECVITDDKLRINQRTRKLQETNVALDDIIAIEKNDAAFNTAIGQSRGTRPKWLCKVHYITRTKQTWKQTTINVTGIESICQDFYSELQRKFNIVAEKRPKRLLLLVNPISGGRYGRSNLKKVQPLFELAGIVCDVKVSEREKHFEEMVKEYDVSTVDGLVVFGGDGSFSEVTNVLIRAAHEKAGRDYNDIDGEFQPCTIPIGVIPSGTGNGISMKAFRSYNAITAALHIIKVGYLNNAQQLNLTFEYLLRMRGFSRRTPGLVFTGNTKPMGLIGEYCDNELLGYASVVSGYGMFTESMYYTDKKRWMRRARYVVMPAYHLLFKTPRLFTAQITMRCRKPQDAAVEGNETEEVEEKVDGDFIGIMMVPLSINIGGFWKTIDPSGTILTYLFGQTPKSTLLRFFMKWVQAQMPTEEEFPTILSRQVTRIHINVQPKDLGDKNFLNYLWNIDGEIFTLKQADITLKLIKDALPLYSSLELDEEPTSEPVSPPNESD